MPKRLTYLTTTNRTWVATTHSFVLSHTRSPTILPPDKFYANERHSSSKKTVKYPLSI